MTTRLTHLEDRLAASPDTVARELGARLDAADASLQRALRRPLAPAQHAALIAQSQALRAARTILMRMANRYGTSYGASSKRSG
ncbi:EscE/YscE/SsaE family type III secretion system needle protein co-chaperone [Pandoraea nosoerga]|uniref:EscE/YscE/SsaE family type III secretion system needle protein co-chaperone n=1 Tax=Pandoraea nosoerga TaxID=2508296 RepID=A0A5E4XGN7_9BURK|nr:EscE/YscE/SsaE family type III secretion system needle protein co-chaperone [Pandoraea nosoerga]MBN4668075.1 EscE/YscE/SsaE family type III secretion system needle protein co-chaperone [Pandoraea nosoerga]MBN4677899.1 EscE/YscE/SsaE family type III secretion system needle protein co-chaperone [Pandoraea nosoerga]MBN4683103.1 EscE/YscE/SsaE family type III secretion system needle protein co-chaperone [Pandoraea nosoerga]MBN4746592.1 EscE/YscE/SsaE family type III secretion system needle prote